MNYGPLIKYALIIVAFVAFCVGLIAYGEHRKQTEWDAAIAQQAIKSAAAVIAQAENTAAVEVRYVHVKEAAKVITKTVEKEVIRYVESPAAKCVLSPDFVHAFDAVSGLLNQSADGLPASASASGDAAEPSGAVITDAEVLRAYEVSSTQYRDLWLAYSTLVEWVRTTYRVAKSH